MITHSKPTLNSYDSKAVHDVLQSGMIAETESISAFEEAISGYLNLRGGVATSSGTSALFLSLKAMDVKPDDEVILPTYVCRSVMDAVEWAGATPVLCDIGDDWCMNVDTVKSKLTRHTIIIIMVHIFGIAGDVKPICDLGVPVIENICQAFGAKKDGKLVGTYGALAICSFHATKLLTTGEGGMVLTSDQKLLERLRQLKYGATQEHKMRYLLPMTNMQSALGLSQINRYNEFLARRQQIADIYFNKLDNLPIDLPKQLCGRSIFFRYPILTKKNFNYLASEFRRLGIEARHGVDSLLHHFIGIEQDSFPVAERLLKQTISIPIYPSLTDDEVENIIKACLDVFK